MIPNIHSIEVYYGLRDVSRRPVANYIHQRMSDQMRIKLVDDLSKQGYIRKVQDDDVMEVSKCN